MSRLSERNSNIRKTPTPLSPGVAGELKQYGGTSAPSGYLECSGQEISRTVYSELFAEIGTKYGVGDGSTTFNLPDGPRSTVEVELGSFAAFTSGTNLSKGQVFQDASGQWFLKVSIAGSLTVAAAQLDLDLSGLGVSLDFIVNGSEVIAGTFSSSGSSARIQSSSLIRTVTGGSSSSNHAVNGVIRLTGKPTDAFVSADSRFSTFDEALESIPIIKLYNDSTDGATVGVNEASSDELGTVRKNKTQIKEINTSQTGSTGTTVLFSFNNLTVGKKYRIELKANIRISNNSSASMRAFHDGVTLALTGTFQNASVGADIGVGFSNFADFTATTTTLDVSWLRQNTGDILYGYATPSQSLAKLTEINDTEETTDFT